VTHYALKFNSLSLLSDEKKWKKRSPGNSKSKTKRLPVSSTATYELPPILGFNYECIKDCKPPSRYVVANDWLVIERRANI
jgi:hypothetical protein